MMDGAIRFCIWMFALAIAPVMVIAFVSGLAISAVGGAFRHGYRADTFDAAMIIGSGAATWSEFRADKGQK